MNSPTNNQTRNTAVRNDGLWRVHHLASGGFFMRQCSSTVEHRFRNAGAVGSNPTTGLSPIISVRGFVSVSPGKKVPLKTDEPTLATSFTPATKQNIAKNLVLARDMCSRKSHPTETPRFPLSPVMSYCSRFGQRSSVQQEESAPLLAGCGFGSVGVGTGHGFATSLVR